MSTAQAVAPTITNEASRPTTPRKLFVNMAVRDLQRSITFFEALGFQFNRHFTDATATCMLVGEDAYVMLLTHERFAGFSHRPTVDASQQSEALFTFSVESREAVDAVVRTAAASGGAAAGTAQDHGFMYEWSFFDPDGHQWGVFWMDPSAVPG
jgi:hypothetical protein